jgi:N6-adenosine-specific RNA methylase IME4
LDFGPSWPEAGKEDFVIPYNIIYADPPWRYSNNGGQGVAENHYPTMNINEICALPVTDIAAKDSALFLWATFPMLTEALRVITAWGFKYKTVAFVWLKQNRVAKTWFYGLGFWTRANAEICLLATRGHPKRQDNSIHQFIVSPIERHSKKPDEARDKIVRLLGDLPRAELFARRPAPGWDVWGNEVQSADFGPTWPEADFSRKEDF